MSFSTRLLKLCPTCRRVSRWGLGPALVATLIIGGCDDGQKIGRLEVAEKFVAEGHTTGAIVELKRFLQKNPDNARARHLLGQVYYRIGKYDYGEKELLRAANLSPDDPNILLDLGRVWLGNKQPTKVRDKLIINESWPAPIRSTAHSLRAAALYSLRDYRTAARSYKTALSLDPTNVDATVGLVQAYEAAKDEEKFQESLLKAIKVAPDNLLLLSLQAGAAFRDRDLSQAEVSFRRQLAQSSDNVRAQLGLAQTLMAKGNYAEARIFLDRVLLQIPRHGNARYLRAIVDFDAKDYKAMRRNSLLALAVLPNHHPSRLLAGIANIALKRYSDARWHLQALLSREPENTAGAELLALAERRIAVAAEQNAARKTTRPLAMDLVLFRLTIINTQSSGADTGENLAKGFLHDGMKALQANRSLLAIEKFSEAIVRDPTLINSLALALAYYRTDQKQRSIGILKRYLGTHAEDQNARAVLANLLLQADHLRDARPQLEMLLIANPSDPIILNNLAWVLLQLGNINRALRLAARAHFLAPNYLAAMNTYGLAMLRTGDRPRAIKLLARASANADGPPDYRLHYAIALAANGNRAEATDVLREILAAEEMASVHHAARSLLSSIE